MRKMRARKEEKSKGGRSKRNKGLYYLTFFLVFVIAFILFSIIFLSVLSAFPDKPRVRGLFQSIVELNVPFFKAFVITGRQVSTQTTCTSISQYGITWTFSSAVECGTFVNGDYWVVGPVTITGITKPHNINGRDGSMINPIPGDNQGYDDRVFGYVGSLDVSRSLPRVIAPGSSLISSISHDECGDAGVPLCTTTMPNAPRPSLKSAAVLTVLSSTPLEGSFRPPYAGNSKPLYHISQVQWNLLLSLIPVAGTPSLSSMEQKIKRVWLDHKGYWTGGYIHPSDNLPHYGRDHSAVINDASLMLMLNFTQQQKQNLTIYFIQIGIDWYGVLNYSDSQYTGYPGNWWWGDCGGGICPGRKWPILFSGMLLNEPAMKNIGTRYTPVKFHEDCQIFYLTSADSSKYPGVAIGTPVWGERHCTKPQNDPGKVSYQFCCTENTLVGAVLSARLTGAKNLWNHNALFDYQDWYMEYTKQQWGVGDFHRSWTDFAERMWDTYRNAVVVSGPDTTKPNVNLLAPGNGGMFSIATQSFNASISDNIDLDDAVFYLWNNAGSLITTNTQIINGENAIVSFGYTLPSEGAYFWNYEASDNSSNRAFASSNFSIIYDTTPPTTPALTASVVNENQVDLSWSSASNSLSGIASYKLYRDDVLLAQLSGSLTDYSDTTTVGGKTYTYKLSVVNGAGLASNNATASSTTPSDTNPPSVSSIIASANSVAVVFSEQVQKTSAETASNYNINNGINVLSAILSNDNRTLTLGTSLHSNGTYTLNVQDVRDIAGNVMGLISMNYTFNVFTCISSSSIWQYFAIPSQI
ncbi:Ig-like domain-containing protein, partial [Candidatus Pacearchaeota archaeon]|nr:Ig-like domain-containing protein [Candidatus Pacearchaeota archaeon]